jgi:DNA repair protein RadC
MKVLGENKLISVTSTPDVAKVFQGFLGAQDAIDQDKEHYWVMHLDARDHIIMVELVGIGILSGAYVHPRETFRRAIAEGTAEIIVAHTHPSGEVDPSEDDIRTTQRLHAAGEILGIPLLDHIVVSPTKYFSFRVNGTGSTEG